MKRNNPNRTVNHPTKRQTRQVASVTSVNTKKLTLKRLNSLKLMILDIKQRRLVGYRWFEQYSDHKFGWWQHIGAGEFDQIHATEKDFNDIQRLHHLLLEDAELDAELLPLVLRRLQKQTELNQIDLEIIDLARRRAGQGHAEKRESALP